MAKGTYIYLDRGILDHWLYQDKPFNRAMAWIDMLLIADHTTHTSMWRGKPTLFKRGDVNKSISQLAERWGWSRGKTRRFILNLETDGMINVKRTSERTVITIVKYEVFQNKRTPKRTPNDTAKRTPSDTPDDTHLSNNKGIIKKYKEGESPTSEEVALAKEEKEKRDPNRLYPGDPGYNPDRLYPGDPNYTDIDWGDDE